MIIIAFLEQDVDIDAVASKIRKLNYEVAIRYHVRVLRINVLNNSKDEALKKIRESTQEVSHIDFYLDSTLVVNQLNGLFKVKDARLRELLSQIRVLEQEVGGVIRYNAVPREQNRRADFLVNQALDEGVR